MANDDPRDRIAELEESVRYYIAKAEQSEARAEEQRERRLALEEEVPFINMPSGRLAYAWRPVGAFSRMGERLDRFLEWMTR